MKTVALHNDRSQYELVLADRIKQLLFDRHAGNAQLLFDMFFDKPDFRAMLLGYLGGTYDEFRAEAG